MPALAASEFGTTSRTRAPKALLGGVAEFLVVAHGLPRLFALFPAALHIAGELDADNGGLAVCADEGVGDFAKFGKRTGDAGVAE
jgi:hypothetical protein